MSIIIRDVVGVPKTSETSFGVRVEDDVPRRFRDVEDAVPYFSLDKSFMDM